MNIYYDTFELAMALFGFDVWNDDDYEKANEQLEELIAEKYEISGENFEKLVKDLVKFTPIAETAITNEKVQGFVNTNRTMFLYKEKVTEEQND